MAEKSVEFILRYVSTRLEKATDIFRDPVTQLGRKVILSILSFILVTVLGALIRFLRLDRLIVNQLYQFIHSASQKTQVVFSQPTLQEDLVYKEVEAFEKFLDSVNE